jgi:hypothetical protein
MNVTIEERPEPRVFCVSHVGPYSSPSSTMIPSPRLSPSCVQTQQW